MSSQSHVSHCRVLPLGEFIVMIQEPYATLQGAVTWRNQCHDRATLQGVRIPSAILKMVFRHILFIFLFFNAIWALTTDGFRIVSDTLVNSVVICLNIVLLNLLLNRYGLMNETFLLPIFLTEKGENTLSRGVSVMCLFQDTGPLYIVVPKKRANFGGL